MIVFQNHFITQNFLISVDDDIDGIPLEKLVSSSAGLKPGGFIPSKWETVDPDQVTTHHRNFSFSQFQKKEKTSADRSSSNHN